jgi:amino acid adenylation domain-containing protein
VGHAIISTRDIQNAFVGVLGAKSLFSYAGICGSLFASRAYMPLNLKFPLSRILKMLERSGTSVIVADNDSYPLLEKLLAESDRSYKIILDADIQQWKARFQQHDFIDCRNYDRQSFPELTASPDTPAYLLFTSGTTGTPKGVPVSNRNVMAYLDHMLSNWDFTPADRFSHTFDLTFDLSVHDMMVCWLSGACLCVPQEDAPLKMISYIKNNDISVWFSVPSVAMLMNKMRLLKENVLGSLRLSFFCGEPLPESIATKWQRAAAGQTTVNLYGPSEATIAISAYTWGETSNKSKNGILSIGKLFPGQEYLLLDIETDMVSQERGELCLSGSQVIDAYLGDTVQSEKSFIPVEGYPGIKWYRTGDLAEVDKDGDLFFLGRIDTEVKISGYRVNLMEVDALVRKASGTDLVASVLDDTKVPRIATFVGSGSKADRQEIISACKHELPWYMIPELIIFADEMPLNDNGKIDRNKLKSSLYE